MLERIMGWKIWAILAAAFGALMYGMKLRGDYYRRKAEESEEALIGAEAEGSTKEFEAAQRERWEHVRKEMERMKGDDEMDDDRITESVD